MLNKLLHKTKVKLVPDTAGFTLIELLIVIVIIGILAGVLIAVIDPTTQQNRARDANVRASMNKLALATAGFVSAYGRIPNETEVLSGLTGVTANGATCGTATDADCQFALSSQPLAVGGTNACGANGWGGTGANQCYYRYCGSATTGADQSGACAFTNTTTTFRLMARAWGSTNVFVYSSADSRMYLCDTAAQNCTAL